MRMKREFSDFFYGLLHNFCNMFYFANYFVAIWASNYCFHSNTVDMPFNVPQYKVDFLSPVSNLTVVFTSVAIFLSSVFQFTDSQRSLE
jgi:hypothetical protein